MNKRMRSNGHHRAEPGRTGSESPNSADDRGQRSGRPWMATIKRLAREFTADAIPDRAAALTYYGVLSIFPGLLVLVSVLGFFGPSTTGKVQDQVREIAPGQVGEFLNQAIDQVRGNAGAAGIAAVLGVLVAFWSASAYVAAFMRASNVIFDVPEGRPAWKMLPTRIGLTAGVGLLLIVSAVIVVFTGDLARRAGNAIGVGSTAVTVWSIAKWPVLLILVSFMFSLLYWASPNARQGGFRWITTGGLIAVLIWLVVSGLFAVYLATFASYNKTYGAIAGVIVFLVWLWLTNLAILLGAEVNAELERRRAIAAGMPDDQEPYLALRDDRKLATDTDSDPES